MCVGPPGVDHRYTAGIQTDIARIPARNSTSSRNLKNATLIQNDEELNLPGVGMFMSPVERRGRLKVDVVKK